MNIKLNVEVKSVTREVKLALQETSDALRRAVATYRIEAGSTKFFGNEGASVIIQQQAGDDGLIDELESLQIGQKATLTLADVSRWPEEELTVAGFAIKGSVLELTLQKKDGEFVTLLLNNGITPEQKTKVRASIGDDGRVTLKFDMMETGLSGLLEREVVRS